MKKSIIKIAVLQILLAEAVGALSAALSGGIKNLYSSLQQPPFSPPGWIFPVAWTILYALMGLAAALMLSAPAPQGAKERGFKLYILQLLLNFIWTPIFFRFESFWLALLVLIALDIFVFLMLIQFYRIRPAAGWLLVPYLIWLLFATYLNLGVALLN